MKTHLGIPYRQFGEDRVRSLCGRSSSYVWDIETITTGQNVTFEQGKVSCKFCQRLLPAFNHNRRHLAA